MVKGEYDPFTDKVKIANEVKNKTYKEWNDQFGN